LRGTRPLEVIEEALQGAPRARLSIARDLAGHAHVHPSRRLRSTGMGAQDVPGHLLERPSSGHLGKGPRPRLAVVREDVEIVLVLGKTVDDPRELPDGIIDMPEGAQSRAVTGAE